MSRLFAIMLAYVLCSGCSGCTSYNDAGRSLIEKADSALLSSTNNPGVQPP